MANANRMALIRETSRGTINVYITRAEAARGLRDGHYIKEYIRDASGRVRGSQLRELYIAPSDSRLDQSILTRSDMMRNVGEDGTLGEQIKARRKIRMWHAVPMCVWPQAVRA